MMRKWYGDDMVKDMAKRGYIVDHINNEHMDCRISNLAFYLKDCKRLIQGELIS